MIKNGLTKLIATSSSSASKTACAELSRLARRSYQRHYATAATAVKETRQTDAQSSRNAADKLKERAFDETDSFVMNLFKGQAKMNQIFPYPNVVTEEQLETVRVVMDPTIRFFREINDAVKNDTNECVSEKTLQALRDLGGFGLQVPPEYGGMGATNTQYVRMGEILGAHDLGLGIIVGAHQSIGFKGILLYGTPEQKTKYLPDLASGKKLAAYCLTEPGSGSDAMSIKTKAVLSPDGKHYILNGSKIWISNGGIADIFTVFAKTPIKMDSGEVKEKITAFIVERDFGGVTSGPPEKKMGIRGSNTTTLSFDDCKVPVENVIGKPGEGFKVAMNILNNGRFGLAATMCGTLKTVIQKATEHAVNRHQFGSSLASYGTTQEKIARMNIAHYVVESLTYVLSQNMDRGFTDYQLEAAITKVVSSESCWYVTDEAIQILGGMGYMKETGLERILRDVRIFRIFEGANDIMRLFVALQGLQYGGGHLKELQKALKNPAANLGLILDEGAKRVKRAVGLSTGPSLNEYVDPRFAASAALASRSIENFGAAVESLLIKYGKNIIHEQFLLNRLSNSAMDIYSMVVVLSRGTSSLKKRLTSAEHEALMVDIICSEASERVQVNLGTLKSGEKLSNFEKMRAISKTSCEAGGVVQTNPVNM